MNYADQQRSPTKHLVGIGFVLVLHLFLAWAAVTGLARKAIDVVKEPFQTKIIEEVKPPPPPDTPPPPPPKMVQVQQVFVPPPEVQISAPAIQTAVITPTTQVAPATFAPPQAPAPVAAKAAEGPPSVGVACPNSQTVRADIKYPVQARREGLQGDVLIEFTVAANGEIKDIDVKSSSNRVFNSASMNAVRQFKCNAQARDVRVQVPFSFKLTD